MSARIRLYVDQPLGKGQAVSVGADQTHYLTSVMRLGAGETVLLFNGRDGEWRAELAEVARRGAIAICAVQTASQLCVAGTLPADPAVHESRARGQ